VHVADFQTFKYLGVFGGKVFVVKEYHYQDVSGWLDEIFNELDECAI
jgi:hypothetical protein